MTKQAKTKKRQKPVIDYLLYLLMRTAGMFIQMGNVNISLTVARFLGRKLYQYYRRGRERALENLRASFPEKDTAWIEQTARRSFEYLAMMVFDVFLTTRLVRPSTWEKYYELDTEELDEVIQLINARQSLVMVTGHYGNFEALGYALAVFGLANYSVGRPIDNPYIDHYLRSVRERQGQTIINKKGATDQMLEVLSSGNLLGLVADQNGSRKDIFVDFFGRKAATYKSIGLLAMQFDAPIVVGFCRRQGNAYRYKIGVNRLIKPEEWKEQSDPLKWITAEYTQAIESFVREDPEQYWWLHRRWKTRPPEERQARQCLE